MRNILCTKCCSRQRTYPFSVLLNETNIIVKATMFGGVWRVENGAHVYVLGFVNANATCMIGSV